MLGLITDRTQANVDRLKALRSKSWAGMTTAEQAEWMGDPLAATGAVNLFPPGPFYSSSVELTYRNSSVTATGTAAGTYLYAVSIIGPAADYEGKTLTLSLDSVYAEGGATPQLSLYWHGNDGMEPAGGGLTEAGSTTFTVTENTAGREYMAMYVYVSTHTHTDIGAFVRYNGLMLEQGSTRHSYIPYTEIIPTDATKGGYNFSDMNRVERAVGELASSMGLNLTVKTDWTVWDIPTQSDLERYLGNIEAVKAACTNSVNVPTVPGSMAGLTYGTANTIETILQTVQRSNDAAPRSGDILVGEV